MSYILINGKKKEIISKKVVTGYINETNREMKKRFKEGKAIPKYQYTAIKVK